MREPQAEQQTEQFQFMEPAKPLDGLQWNHNGSIWFLDPDHPAHGGNLASMSTMQLLILQAYLDENLRWVQLEVATRRGERHE